MRVKTVSHQTMTPDRVRPHSKSVYTVSRPARTTQSLREQKSEVGMSGKSRVETEGSEPADVKIVFEGGLLQYKPGVKVNFLPRWGEITSTDFRYYKTQWSAHVSPTRPLLAIPLSLISSVALVTPSPADPFASYSPPQRHIFELSVLGRFTPATGRLSSKQTWSARAQLWDSPRLLFSVRSAAEAETWMALLQASKHKL